MKSNGEQSWQKNGKKYLITNFKFKDNNPDGVTAVAAETMAPKGRPGKCLIPLPVGSSVLCRRCLSYWAPPTQPATPMAKAPPTFKNFILLDNCTESL